MLIETNLEFINLHLHLIEAKIKIQITILWLRYEQTKIEMLINLIEKLQDLNSQYDFTIKCYLLDVLSHIMTLRIDLFEQVHDLILHHIQTTSMLPWRRYAFRWAPTSRMWMLC